MFSPGYTYYQELKKLNEIQNLFNDTLHFRDNLIMTRQNEVIFLFLIVCGVT